MSLCAYDLGMYFPLDNSELQRCKAESWWWFHGANNTHMRFSFYRQMIQSRDSCGCDPLLRMSSNIPANLNSQEEELRSTLSPSVQHGSETYAFASWNSHEQSIHCTCIMEIRSHGSDVHLCLCRRTTALVEYLLSGPSVLESRG